MTYNHLNRSAFPSGERLCIPPRHVGVAADVKCGVCGVPAHLSTWAEGHVASLQSLGSGYFGWMSTADRNERCQSHEVYTHHTPENSCSNAFCNKTLATLTCVHVPEKFSYKGIYNNKRNCHCHMSWDRPRCPQQGAGGSDNSGPSPPKKKLAKNTRLTINIVFALGLLSLLCLKMHSSGVAAHMRLIETTKITGGICVETR